MFCHTTLLYKAAYFHHHRYAGVQLEQRMTIDYYAAGGTDRFLFFLFYLFIFFFSCALLCFLYV